MKDEQIDESALGVYISSSLNRHIDNTIRQRQSNSSNSHGLDLAHGPDSEIPDWPYLDVNLPDP